jgi:drug/metabolite transporter (DMT)-like permease
LNPAPAPGPSPASPPAAAQAAQAAAWLPALALCFNAFTWGVSWWPFRWLEAHGLHPLWATAMIYLLAVLVILAWQPGALGVLWRTRSLWWLVLASGTTNAAFNWAVTIGDVVRVVLLFYLMPLWAVLLARWLLKEPLTPSAMLRVALGLGGALVVLWPAEGGWPWPRSLADGLGLLGGFSFALNNVLLRREAHRPESARALAMFAGGVVVASLLALALYSSGRIAAPPAPAAVWMLGAGLLAIAFLGGNLALQYGAARLPANVTAVVMVSEVLFASASAVLLGAGALTTALLIGGSMIIGAALLAAWRP